MSETPTEGAATLGKYQVLGTLGRGSMGVVYKAEDPEIGRIVAIKTLRKLGAKEGGDATKAIERFRTEARSAGRLRHPNIITIFDASIDGDTPFIVMDYVEGDSLDVVIGRDGKIEPARAVSLLRQLADALDEAHRQGVIHRDIKPSNLVIDTQGRLYVLDFGVAKLHETIQETDAERTGNEPVMGTPAYMSPEQILNKKLDHRSDLFSLALVAYELLTGRRPFPGENFKEVVNGILHAPPIPISSILPDVPLQVEVEFEHALAKKPEDRFGSAVETVRVLEAAFAGKIGAARSSGVAASADSGKRGRTASEWKSIGSGQQHRQSGGGIPPQPRPPAPSAAAASDSSSSRKPSPSGALVPSPSGSNRPSTGYTSAPITSPYATPGGAFEYDNQIVSQSVRFRPQFSFSRVIILFFGVVAIGCASFLVISYAMDKSYKEILGGPTEEDPNVTRKKLFEGTIRPRPGKATLQSEELAAAPAELSDDQLYALLMSKDVEVSRLVETLKIADGRKVPGLVKACVHLLDHDSYVVRLEAIKILGASRDRGVAPVLLKYLEDFDPLVRSAVAKALGQLGSSQSVAYLKQRYKVEEKSTVKAAIKKSIEKITGLPFKG